MKNSWGLKQFKIKLIHRLKQYELERLRAIRRYTTREVLLDEFLVTRKVCRSEDDKARDFLAERLRLNNFKYDC